MPMKIIRERADRIYPLGQTGISTFVNASPSNNNNIILFVQSAEIIPPAIKQIPTARVRETAGAPQN